MKTRTTIAAVVLALTTVLAACGDPQQVKNLQRDLASYKQELTDRDAKMAASRDSLAELREELATLEVGRPARNLALLDTLEVAAPKPDSIDGIPAPTGMLWSEILAGTLAVLGRRNFIQDQEETYIREVYLINFCFQPDYRGWCDEGRADLAALAADERKLRTLGEWGLKSAELLDGIAQGNTRQWLRDYWVASHEDMATLRRIVEANPDYLYEASKKLEGRFMRRWVDVGGGAHGDDLLIVYRFWMARLAGRLNMPEAVGWREKVRTSLARTTTLEVVWYLDRIDT